MTSALIVVDVQRGLDPGCGDVGAEPAQAFAAEVSPGVGRRVVDSVEHLLLGEHDAAVGVETAGPAARQPVGPATPRASGAARATR